MSSQYSKKEVKAILTPAYTDRKNCDTMSIEPTMRTEGIDMSVFGELNSEIKRLDEKIDLKFEILNNKIDHKFEAIDYKFEAIDHKFGAIETSIENKILTSEMNLLKSQRETAKWIIGAICVPSVLLIIQLLVQFLSNN